MKSLSGYYEKLTEEDLSRINAVSMDMWEPFMSSTMKHVPDADPKIVFVRFHVFKHVNGAAGSTQKKENRDIAEKGMMDPQGNKVHKALRI